VVSDAAAAALLESLTAIAVQAAAAILQHSASDNVRAKADGSPITAADEAAEATIRDGLARLAPGFAVISEEQAEPHRPPAPGAGVILVDPLDGTRDFIAGRSEYTVNIGLLKNGAPVLGVIAAPALRLVWRGIVGSSAERLAFDREGVLALESRIHTRKYRATDFTVMVSRSHLDAVTEDYLAALPQAKTLVPSGSAIKFCRLAEGAADHYPRLAPTCDWDVAAGHAVLAAAGGSVTAPDGGALRYGSDNLHIPGFVAWGDPAAAAAMLTG
jgi:3'(2'), 5'-bisphosphate nucleotidase